MGMSLSKLQEIENDREAWHAAADGGHKRLGHDLVIEQEQLN